MAKLIHRELILAKLESSYNTDAAPTAAANAILVQNLSWADAGLRMDKRPAIRGNSIAMLQDIYGGELKEFSFDTEVKGSGAAGTAPEIDPLLQACATTATIVASTSVTYDPNSNPATMGSVTIYYYEDGSLHKITGARGNVSFDIKTGGVVIAKFKMTGHIESYTDVVLPTPTFNATVPVAAINVAATFGAYSPVLDTFMVDLGNKIEMPPALGATDGYGAVIISSRDVKGNMDPEADTIANINYFSDLSVGTTVDFTTGAIGATAGNKVTFTIPKLYLVKIAPKARNEIRVYTLDFQAVENAGVDNEISIVFT